MANKMLAIAAFPESAARIVLVDPEANAEDAVNFPSWDVWGPELVETVLGICTEHEDEITCIDFWGVRDYLIYMAQKINDNVNIPVTIMGEEI